MKTPIKKKKSWRNLIEFLHGIKEQKDFEEVVLTLLTLHEQDQVVDRFLIILGLLEKKKTQRELSGALSTSIAKITRGGNFLKVTKQRTKDLFIEYIKKRDTDE